MEQQLMNLLPTTQDSTRRKCQTSTCNHTNKMTQLKLFTVFKFFTVVKTCLRALTRIFSICVLTPGKRRLTIIHLSSIILHQSLVKKKRTTLLLHVRVGKHRHHSLLISYQTCTLKNIFTEKLYTTNSPLKLLIQF